MVTTVINIASTHLSYHPIIPKCKIVRTIGVYNSKALIILWLYWGLTIELKK